ncbi:hypothetical protein CKA56_16045, partial [Arcobacter venerupis]
GGGGPGHNGDGGHTGVAAVGQGGGRGKSPSVTSDGYCASNRLAVAVSDHHRDRAVGGIKAAIDDRAGVITDEVRCRAAGVVSHAVDRDGHAVAILVNAGINHHDLGVGGGVTRHIGEGGHNGVAAVGQGGGRGKYPAVTSAGYCASTARAVAVRDPPRDRAVGGIQSPLHDMARVATADVPVR